VRAFPIVAFALAVLSCKGGSSPTSPPATQTLAFSGTARATGPTSCAGGSHAFAAGSGTVTVRLDQSTGNTALVVQVCAGAVDNNNCTINQRRLEVGQSVSGMRVGTANQVLAVNPLNCGGGGPAPSEPIAYSVTVMYQQ